SRTLRRLLLFPRVDRSRTDGTAWPWHALPAELRYSAACRAEGKSQRLGILQTIRVLAFPRGRCRFQRKLRHTFWCKYTRAYLSLRPASLAANEGFSVRTRLDWRRQRIAGCVFERRIQ